MENLVIEMRNPSIDFWNGKRVFVTGHTGFKGSWLVYWLHQLGANVHALSLEPSTQPNLFSMLGIKQICSSQFGDINQLEVVKKAMINSRADVVFHLAAQALVKPAYEDPISTFQTNVIGSANVLEAIRYTHSVKVCVMITTDKVYDNQEWCWPYRELDRLGGHDPYSASKAACEIMIDSYKKSFLSASGVAVSSARAGNVIGGGDWSEYRLIPDAVKAWQQGETLSIRNPDAIRPWQHVLEPLNAYLRLAQLTWDKPELAQSYNLGPEASEAASVSQVIESARTYWSQAKVNYSKNPLTQHEAKLLTLDTNKAKQKLGISPRLKLGQSIAMTMQWYKGVEQGQLAADLCQSNILEYSSAYEPF
jgi:CDP-glucose 4,6-dehydratase